MPWTDHIKYADVGNKVDYAVILPGKTDKDPTKFVGWIRKFVVKFLVENRGIAAPVKMKKEDAGL